MEFPEVGSDPSKKRSLQIRLATKDDVGLLIQLRLSYLAESFKEFGKEEQEQLTGQLHDYFERQLCKSLFAIIASEEGNVVLTAFLVIDERPGNPFFPNGRVGTILNVYTLPNHRKKGYATKVMEKLLSLAKERNISRIDLKATSSGIPLYEQLGFKKSGDEYVQMQYLLK